MNARPIIQSLFFSSLIYSLFFSSLIYSSDEAARGARVSLPNRTRGVSGPDPNLTQSPVCLVSVRAPGTPLQGIRCSIPRSVRARVPRTGYPASQTQMLDHSSHRSSDLGLFAVSSDRDQYQRVTATPWQSAMSDQPWHDASIRYRCSLWLDAILSARLYRQR